MKRAFWLILSLASFIMLGYLCLISNTDKIDILTADYYFKNDNIDSAIEFYEKAFQAGAKDEKSRYNYVSILTNSPLNIENQERLVKFTEYPIDDSAKDKALSFLSDLRLQIHQKYPDNYISQGTYNQKILRWSSNPITYEFTNPDIAPEYFVKQIESAFDTWEKALDKKVTFIRAENNPNIIIQFNDYKQGTDTEEKYVAALTKPNINSNILTNMITDYTIKSPDGNFFTENQIYNTALHEIAHALGFMGHSDYKKNIMYVTTDIQTVTDDIKKSLTKADINTIKLLYLIKPDITNNKIKDGDYIKYVIIGNDTEVANAKMKEAQVYIKKLPELPAGYIDLADAYIGKGEYQKAITCLTKALPLAKDTETAQIINYNLAVSNYYIAEHEKSISYLKKAGALQNTETANRLLAENYTALGKKIEAISLYENLISKNQTNIDYVISLTNIYVKDKEYLKARTVLKNFVLMNPDEKNNPRLAPYGIIKAFL